MATSTSATKNTPAAAPTYHEARAADRIQALGALRAEAVRFARALAAARDVAATNSFDDIAGDLASLKWSLEPSDADLEAAVILRAVHENAPRLSMPASADLANALTCPDAFTKAQVA